MVHADLATPSLAEIRGLQLDQLARTGEGPRMDAALQEMLRLLALASRGVPNHDARQSPEEVSKDKYCGRSRRAKETSLSTAGGQEAEGRPH